ncbi:MAG TPA: gliding motility-associated ABC transporter permease subunit GldF [Bacteroidales bacterium]|jgi:ABC-2 type transport system permease protein|nr:gliding motility-associated ABC transporter permease subunit GldF [Bacteroidales bacterium]MDD4395221.1 gliding motility-associated ABC transporter permease subunit GldF [Bacteroidales bacterium]HNW67257.1 gliding motility-associated ABC transporter permease subunit GldF [Bacteroidales bacterium]HPT51942.1 gliding motility-associated ABC transporter permease subunit GldF [Bacteroidales bacterium]
MFTLYLKEIKSFFSSIMGYIIIGVFLIVTGLFLWVFPNYYNIFEAKTADLQGLFNLSCYLFLFLIPAITMRSFSEEKKTGTIELLFTKPISDWQIIIGKFLACVTVLVIALLPTIIYFISIWKLGDPIGNIDTGSTWGSYLGLLLLGVTFVSIGIFASSITNNQIIAFLLGALFCFFIHFGFEFIYSLEVFGSFGSVIKSIGIEHHYIAISKGVVDTRDIIYFITVTFIFLFGTKIVLLSRKW